MTLRPRSLLSPVRTPRLPASLGAGVVRLVLVVLVAVGCALAVAVDPRFGLAAAAAVIAATGLALVSGRLRDVTLGLLGLVLVGYAFMSRGFAYVGVAPLFVGEAMLALMLLAWLRGPRERYAGPVPPLLVAFMAWGAVATIPYLGVYGLDAVRDAVTWGYGLFALALATMVAERHLRTAARLYAVVLPLFLVWVPLAGILTRIVTLPTTPGSDVPIVVFKGGDVGVLLAGVGAFVMVGLYQRVRPALRVPEPLLWTAWIAAVAVAGSLNRGGLLAAATVGITIVSARAAARWVALVFVALALLVPLSIVDPRVDVGGDRELSIGQVLENVTSIFSQTDDPALEGTESFRLAWWSTIVGYTVDGPYFWTGKGYGINLADEDGFQPTADGSLRAPHNGHVEILARSGVPGLVLWIALQAVFGTMVLRSLARTRALEDPWWSQVLAWVLTSWLAALVNSTFDPYLQGPQGGILFWSIVGVGIAAMRDAERAIARARADVAPAAPAAPAAAGAATP